jgi:putative hydrolase
VKPIEFKRFSEMDAASVNRDLHVHTVATDGAGTVAENLEAARDIGLGEIAFTDHIRRESTYFPEYAKLVRAEAERTDVRVFLGFEAKALDEDGSLDAPDVAMKEADIRLGSVHRFPVRRGGLMKVSEFSYEEASEIEYRLARGLARHAPIDVLAHPGGMCLRTFGRFPEDKLLDLMCETLERGIAFEINNAHIPDFDRFIELCRDVDPIVSIGSDAHQLARLGDCRNALRARGVGR